MQLDSKPSKLQHPRRVKIPSNWMKLDAASILLNPLQYISKSHSSFTLWSAAQRISSKSSNLQSTSFFYNASINFMEPWISSYEI